MDILIIACKIFLLFTVKTNITVFKKKWLHTTIWNKFSFKPEKNKRFIDLLKIYAFSFFFVYSIELSDNQ